MNKKECWVLTGGIASGKSTTMKWMRSNMGALMTFDCDEAVQRLLKEAAVLNEISEKLKTSITSSDGTLNRPLLRRLTFEETHNRLILERILHPKIRKELLESQRKFLLTPAARLFVVDVPLFFESKFDFDHDLVVLVACSESTQRVRLRARSQLSDLMIDQILQAQLPILSKVRNSHVMVWNEGQPVVLEEQLQRLTNFIPNE